MPRKHSPDRPVWTPHAARLPAPRAAGSREESTPESRRRHATGENELNRPLAERIGATTRKEASMTRATLFLLSAALVFASPSSIIAEQTASDSAEKHLLRYRFEPGETVRWQVVHLAKF